jgi:ethanolamine utilization microcompartment shell protein EutS
VDPAALQKTLVSQGAILEYVPSSQTPLIHLFTHPKGGR